MRVHVVSDFDGTLLKYDLPDVALEKFGERGWELYDDLMNQDKLTLEASISGQYGKIRLESRKQLIEYLDNYCVFRKGVRGLIDACRKRKMYFTIASAGFDFTIRYAFKKERIPLPKLLCPKLTLSENNHTMILDFPSIYSTGNRGRFGSEAFSDYKEAFVASRQKKGEFVVYIGDGRGDYHAAKRANKVFAIEGSTLDKLFSNEGISHASIKDLRAVEKELAGGLIGSLR